MINEITNVYLRNNTYLDTLLTKTVYSIPQGSILLHTYKYKHFNRIELIYLYCGVIYIHEDGKFQRFYKCSIIL